MPTQSGLVMMLKAFGVEIDPEKIKTDIQQFASGLQGKIAEVDSKLAIIESKLDQLLEQKQRELKGVLQDGNTVQ